MTEVEKDELCRKCGQPKKKVDSGRLTQWIKICSCGESALQQQQTTNFELCATCGKRIAKSRPGSFTQWVFRPDNCDCASTSKRGTKAGADLADKQSSPSVSFDDNEAERQRQRELYGDRVPVSRYLVYSEIGRGAAGTVYLCRDRLLKKKVAIKSINSVGRESLLAFQQEAKATSRLNHPNIVRVIDFGCTENGTPYMVLEYFDGISLEKYIQQHSIVEPYLAMEIMIRMCDALAYAHQQRVWHRDLKPSNVLISGIAGGNIDVRLIDFGVAAFKQGTDTLSPQSTDQSPVYRTLVGTPSYMSPDQALGREYDARSEVYSLGCILFEMLAGHPPYVGETPLETIAMHSQRAVPPIGDITGDTATAVRIEEIVRKCLAKDPDERFQDVAELRQALTGDDLDVMREDAGSTSSSVPKSGKNSASVLMVCLFVTISLLAYLGWYIYSTFSEQKQQSNGNDRADLGDIDVDDNGEYFQVSVRGHDWYCIMDSRPKGTLRLLKSLGPVNNVWLVSPISDSIIKYISGLPLHGLAFDESSFTDKQIAQLTEIKDLSILVILNSNISDENVRQISKLKRLTNVVLQSSNMTTKSLDYLTDMPELVGLSVSGMRQIKDGAVDRFLKMPALRGVGVSRTGITSDGVIRLIKSGKFVAMNIGELSLDHAVYDALKQSNVQRLGFIYNPRVTPEMYDCFAAMPQLQLLDLRYCKPVSLDLINEMNSRRKKSGFAACRVLYGQDNMARDWDIMFTYK